MTSEVPSEEQQGDINSAERIEAALLRARIWLDDEYSKFLTSTGLTPELLSNPIKLREALGRSAVFDYQTEQGPVQYGVVDAGPVNTLFGVMKRVRVGRVGPGSSQSGFSLLSNNDFLTLSGLGVGWDSEEAPIEYSNVTLNEKGIHISQITKPSVLYPGPGMRGKNQALVLQIDTDSGVVGDWVWEMSVGEDLSSKKDSHGNNEVSGSFALDFIIPSDLNIPQVIENILDSRPATQSVSFL